MTDFGPLIANPISLLLGAAAQFGIYIAFMLANATGLFTVGEAAAIGLIGGADGPTAIYVANNLAPDLVAPIAVAAYSYMALIPLIQPPIMKLLTTKKERSIVMKQLRKVSKVEKIVFPVFVVLFCSLLLPSVAPLLGMLLCAVTGGKINPLIGSAGVSAVPMAARVAQTVGAKENPTNFLLMHAMGPNVAGVIGSAVAAGFFMLIFG